MKTIIYLSILICFIACTKTISTVEWKDITEKEGLYYHNDQPFTGKIYQNYSNGKKEFEIECKDGKKNGLHISWFENGKQESEETNVNGIQEGKAKYWYDNGNLSYEVTYKNGKKEGIEIDYNEDGKKTGQSTYKAGNLDGPYIKYHENGNKEEEGNVRETSDSEIHYGLRTYYYENGKKQYEVTYGNDGYYKGPYASWDENGVKTQEGVHE